MTVTGQPTIPTSSARKAQMFPQLTAAQIARLEAHGPHRPTSRGEILKLLVINKDRLRAIIQAELTVEWP